MKTRFNFVPISWSKVCSHQTPLSPSHNKYCADEQNGYVTHSAHHNAHQKIKGVACQFCNDGDRVARRWWTFTRRTLLWFSIPLVAERSKALFKLCDLRLRFVFAYHGLYSSWWYCRSCMVWTLPMSPVQPICCDKRNRSHNQKKRTMWMSSKPHRLHDLDRCFAVIALYRTFKSIMLSPLLTWHETISRVTPLIFTK